MLVFAHIRLFYNLQKQVIIEVFWKRIDFKKSKYNYKKNIRNHKSFV